MKTMKTKKTPWHIGRRRLLKLSDHLDGIPRKQFDYSNFSHVEDGDGNVCGTLGCAAGHCPAVFREWAWCKRWSGFRHSMHLGPTIRGKNRNSIERNLCSFFGLGGWGVYALFYPESSIKRQSNPYPIRSPGASATPKQVAAHFRRLIKLHDSGEVNLLENWK